MICQLKDGEVSQLYFFNVIFMGYVGWVQRAISWGVFRIVTSQNAGAPGDARRLLVRE